MAAVRNISTLITYLQLSVSHWLTVLRPVLNHQREAEKRSKFSSLLMTNSNRTDRLFRHRIWLYWVWLILYILVEESSYLS